MDSPISDRRRLAALYVLPNLSTVVKQLPFHFPDPGTGFVPVAKSRTSNVCPTLLQDVQLPKQSHPTRQNRQRQKLCRWGKMKTPTPQF